MSYTNFTVYDETTGRVVRFGRCPQSGLEGQPLPGERVLQAQGSFDQYVENETLVPIPARPSDSHDWDWQTKAWEPNPADVREKKRVAVAQEFARRTLWPIQYDGAAFDADEVAHGRIIATLTRMIRGDGLPVGWIGWRDYANAMHWGADTPEQVQTQLAGLAGAIEDREQALLVAAWQHKAALDALTDIDAILAYDTAGNWPS